MIPFDKLELKVSEDSFVGIKKEDKRYVFYLPLGFEEFKNLNPSKSEVKKLFFQFFKIIQKETNKTKPRDGEEGRKGIGGENEKEHPIFYENLNIGELIKGYDDTKIQAINTFKSMGDIVDFSNINYDEVYYTQKNELIVLETLQPKNQIKYSPTDIIRMYGFIYEDIYNQLNKDIYSEIKFLANDFREKFGIVGSLFDDEKLAEEFKDILEEIDLNITIKPPEYFEFYEKIYKFLYYSPNKDGIVAGIDNFHSIWEKICLNYAFRYWENNVLFTDCKQYDKEKANCKLNGYKRMYCKEANEENYPFKITYRDEIKYIYPDLVITSIPINIYYLYLKEKKEEEKKIEIEKFFKKHKNSLLLVRENNWNDWGYKSEFVLYFNVNENINCKIINDEYNNTHKIFEKYENNKIDFINLNNKILSRFYLDKENNPYKELINRFPYSYLFILKQLQDYYYLKEYNKNKLEIFKRKESYKKSFLRIGIFDEKFEKIDKEIQYKLPIINGIIIDFKYKKSSDIDLKDQIKQKFYELALDKSISLFVLPKYEDNNEIILDTENVTNKIIPIQYWNMKVLLEEYVND